ncbi:sensor histidine kinase [Sphingomonas psychrotolerans]|nr:PAS domain-containing sensor histidine kinase [Sphingomonas psychrotolerans]
MSTHARSAYRDFPATGFHPRAFGFPRLIMSAEKHSPEDVALSLTLAIVTSSPEPLLLLDGQLTIIAASTSFCSVFGANAAQLTGQPLYALDDGEWDSTQLRSLMVATMSGEGTLDARDIDVQRPQQQVRHLIVQARRLVYLDLEQTRILVAVSDVTDARADMTLKEEAARGNRVLLQEVRHRVANSLQIIASVLLRNARTTTSEETRGHLQNAHHRVMSVAALERLLSTSEDGDIEVHAYFTRLCESISASMIGEVDQISLTVEGGDGVVEARVSVSLGLIVTELVINALKHAFPDGRPGKITVDYNFHGPNWILCVRDDGVGMPLTAPVRTGLGASIVAALAGQLNALVEVTPAHPGTQVSIKHTRIALVEDEPEAASELLTAARPASSAIGS